ncbi:hypothetical protein NUU61_002158 [Penicillium alfredii]|uniref:RNA 3'-terminal phosphate cyclase domain-containing protein n=1 Tax=Penicillium alfredii TaxID=1506179 RepID=A0A9W9FQZ3_9EURO|nr:uncharacterized protein NUU61_002158 [Penicillium alfredii]KAJ5104811.1 hypothetical protein NUU61_002158 [Penicillium alfredii]
MEEQSSTSTGSGSPPKPSKQIRLDGRTLEGGGQLVRIALALSSLTGRSVIIDHIRGNREGKKGLRGSHAAAVQLLADISGSIVSGGDVGSQSLCFFSPHDDVSPLISASRASLISPSNLRVQSEYDIRLPTAGSIFLVFQALYPYLLHVGSQAATPCIKATITGGTNVSYAPSYDYASQVMAPNFARLGLPRLSVQLHSRGWSSGSTNLGAVSFFVHPLGSYEGQDGEIEDKTLAEGQNDDTLRPRGCFPRISIMDYERGKMTRIDITVLAPDNPCLGASTVRQYAEHAIQHTLRHELKSLDPSIFETHSPRHHDPLSDTLEGDLPVLIHIHTSERTYHRSHLYFLIVAHTSTGFRIGHNALFGSYGGDQPKRAKHHKKRKGPKDKSRNSQDDVAVVQNLVDQCVQGFIQEVTNQNPDMRTDQAPDSEIGKRACLDMYMRDQIVVFEALGQLCGENMKKKPGEHDSKMEDERYWTLHTKTAQWVCSQMLDDQT